MKRIILPLFMLAAIARAQLPFISIDTTSRVTNTTFSLFYLTSTNVCTNAPSIAVNTNNIQVGTNIAAAFAEINWDFELINNWMETNTFSGGTGGADTNLDNISVSGSNVIASIASVYAGNATNAIGNNGGYGTNATLVGTTFFAGVGATNLVPIMTSSNTPSGVASGSSYFGLDYPWKAFTGLSSTWETAANQATNWLEYQFPSAVTLSSFSADFTGANAPTGFNFQGSPDGSTWTTLFYTNFNYVAVSGSFAPSTYQYWRMFFTNNWSPSFTFLVKNVQFFGTKGQAVISSQSLDISAPNGMGINTNFNGYYSLSVGGAVNASDMYFVGDQPIFNVINVSGGTNSSALYNGTYSLGFGGHVFTNVADGAALFLKGTYLVNGYWVEISNYSFITNVNDMSFSIFTNVPVYFNPTLLGQYLPGFSSPAGVTVSIPVLLGSSSGVGVQTNIVGPHGVTLLFTNGLFYGTTQY